MSLETEEEFAAFIGQTKELHSHLCQYFAGKDISPKNGLQILLAEVVLMTEAIKKVKDNGVDIG